MALITLGPDGPSGQSGVRPGDALLNPTRLIIGFLTPTEPESLSRVGRSRRLGRLVFFVPIVALVLLLAVGLISYVSSESGTLVVVAESAGRYSSGVQLHVTVTVGSSTGTTPANFTLPAGYYTVTYGAAAWYVTPSSRNTTVSGGKTQYAVGLYSPALKVIGVTDGGFNVTAVSALHEVTPVIWVNVGSSAVTMDINSLGRVSLYPSQNYTHVFPASGTFYYDILNTNQTGSVQVS